MSSTYEPPDDDVIFDLLASPRRRLLLYLLFTHEDGVRLWDLSREIVAHETEAHPTDIDSEDVRRVYISLSQTHVPALEAHGILEYDDTDNVVVIDDRKNEILAMMANGPPRTRRWAVYYLAVAALLCGVILGAVIPDAPVSNSVLVMATVSAAAALVFLACFHYRTRVRRNTDPAIERLAP